jgi:NTP pyrophosphatase (non-canonical NTP hydrolase)
MNLATLQLEVNEWAARNFKGKQPHQPLLGVAEEVGELCHAHLKNEQGIRGTKEEHYAAKCDAVGDIVVYLADYCTQNMISLDSAVADAWFEVKQRDWEKNHKAGK